MHQDREREEEEEREEGSLFKHSHLSQITTGQSLLANVAFIQCNQIWRFIGLWATFQSLGQQLICPNLPHS